MAKKQSKQTQAQPTEVLVITEKSGKAGENVTRANIYVPTVTPIELESTSSIMQMLCLNLMAGNVAHEILEAHAKRGGLARLFPYMPNADRNALRVCLDSTPDKLVNAWETHASKAKRVRGINLQALARQVRPAAEKSDKVTLREALEAWAGKHIAWVNSKSCPKELSDILVDYDLLPADEE